MQKLTLDIPIIFVLLLICFFSPPTIGHRMVADGLVGLGSSVLDFPAHWLGCETFLACCGIPYAIHLWVDFLCSHDLDKVLHKKIWVSWYSEPSQPQRITSGLKSTFNLSPIYSASQSSNHKFSNIYKISLNTNLHKQNIHTQTSNITFSKN